MYAEDASAEFKLRQTDKLPPLGPLVLSQHSRLFGDIGYGDSSGAGVWHVSGWCYCLSEAGAPSCGVFSSCTGAVRASLGVNEKKGGCSRWWASAGPQDTCCWPLFPQTAASNVRGLSCVSWKALCEVKRWGLKEDTLLCMKITTFPVVRAIDWLNKKCDWLSGSVWWGQRLKKRHLPLDHH